jgi:hypothetical protein
MVALITLPPTQTFSLEYYLEKALKRMNLIGKETINIFSI